MKEAFGDDGWRDRAATRSREWPNRLNSVQARKGVACAMATLVLWVLQKSYSSAPASVDPPPLATCKVCKAQSPLTELLSTQLALPFCIPLRSNLTVPIPCYSRNQADGQGPDCVQCGGGGFCACTSPPKPVKEISVSFVGRKMEAVSLHSYTSA